MVRFKYETDYPLALDILFRVVQSSVHDFQRLEDWYSHAHALALKLFRHLSTIQHLCRPTFDTTTGDLIVDHSSINALNRTAFETFLTFAYIFGAPNRDLARLRYALWSRCGLMERSKYANPLNDAQTQQLASERSSINELRLEVEASPLFTVEYTPGHRRRLLEKGEWTGVHKAPWIAEKVGMHPNYFRKIYKHTSGHAHSSYISALQVTQARDVGTQMELAKYSLGTGLLIMTHFLVAFCALSSQAKSTLDSHKDSEHVFKRWYIQKDDWDKV